MKIGILTFHRAENFGAALQCYALQTFLKNEGHDVLVIDYRCKSIEHQYQILNPSILLSRRNILISLEKYLARIKTWKRRQIKKMKYEEFRRNFLILTEKYDTINNLNGFDIIIAGSDQIWRLGLTGDDYTYWLNFQTEVKTKRIAYAASSEPSDFFRLNIIKDKIMSFLENFQAISVREEILKEELNRIVNRNIRVVADPTFLLRKEDYLKMMKQPRQSGYVFVYYLFDSVEALEVAQSIANKSGTEVIEMFAALTNKKDDQNHKSTLGPQEILGYINNASCIVTTSFHGLALSIIMEKEFWVVEKGANKRLVNLLKKVGLEDRLIKNSSQLKDSLIDYQLVNKNKEVFINDSTAFLRDNL